MLLLRLLCSLSVPAAADLMLVTYRDHHNAFSPDTPNATFINRAKNMTAPRRMLSFIFSAIMVRQGACKHRIMQRRAQAWGNCAPFATAAGGGRTQELQLTRLTLPCSLCDQQVHYFLWIIRQLRPRTDTLRGCRLSAD